MISWVFILNTTQKCRVIFIPKICIRLSPKPNKAKEAPSSAIAGFLLSVKTVAMVMKRTMKKKTKEKNEFYPEESVLVKFTEKNLKTGRQLNLVSERSRFC